MTTPTDRDDLTNSQAELAALLDEDAAQPVHLNHFAGRVKCGAPMRDRTHPDGWDMGNSTSSPAETTCPDCLATFSRSAVS